MTRVGAWQNRNLEEVSDIEDVIADDLRVISVYRNSSPSANDAFISAPTAQTYYKSINARIDETRAAYRQTTAAGEETINEFIGTTTDTDVLINDVWKDGSDAFRVTKVDNIGQPFLEVGLEIIQ